MNRLLEKTKNSMPKKSALVETFGFILFGFGLYMGVALVSFSSSENLGGPLGTKMAEFLLRSIGIVSLLWVFTFMLLGLFLILGFTGWPKPKRFSAFLLITAVLAGISHVQIPQLKLPHQPFGYGGFIGRDLGDFLLGTVGYGGSLIVLCLLAAAILVLTGNLTVSKTAELLQYGVYYLRKLMFESPHSKQIILQVPAKVRSGKKNKKKDPKSAPEEQEEEIRNLIKLDLSPIIQNPVKISRMSRNRLPARTNTNRKAPPQNEKIERARSHQLIRSEVIKSVLCCLMTTVRRQAAVNHQARRIDKTGSKRNIRFSVRTRSGSAAPHANSINVC